MTEIDTADPLAGIGAHHPHDPRGPLVFDSLPPEIQRAEQQTQFADYERRHWRASLPEERPATSAERLLLEHLGYTVPNDLTTCVRWLSNGVRRRTWPQLNDQHPNNDEETGDDDDE